MEKNKRVKDSSDLPPLVTRHEIFIIIIMIIVAIQCAVLCLVTQSCPTLCNLMDCSPPGSSVHGIFQAGVLEWVVIAFSVAISV